GDGAAACPRAGRRPGLSRGLGTLSYTCPQAIELAAPSPRARAFRFERRLRRRNRSGGGSEGGRSPPPRFLGYQPVELARVLAGHLVSQLRGQMAELLVDVLGRLRPHAVPVRIVRAPHQRLHAHVVDELGADAVELEGRLALAAPVVARLHLQAK